MEKIEVKRGYVFQWMEAIEGRASATAEDRELWLDQLRAGQPVPRYFGQE